MSLSAAASWSPEPDRKRVEVSSAPVADEPPDRRRAHLHVSNSARYRKISDQRKSSIKSHLERAIDLHRSEGAEAVGADDPYLRMEAWHDRQQAGKCAQSHLSAIPLVDVFEIELQDPRLTDDLLAARAVIVEYLPEAKQTAIMAAARIGALELVTITGSGLHLARERRGLKHRLWLKLFGIRKTKIERAMRLA